DALLDRRSVLALALPPLLRGLRERGSGTKQAHCDDRRRETLYREDAHGGLHRPSNDLNGPAPSAKAATSASRGSVCKPKNVRLVATTPLIAGAAHGKPNRLPDLDLRYSRRVPDHSAAREMAAGCARIAGCRSPRPRGRGRPFTPSVRRRTGPAPIRWRTSWN